MTGLFMNKAADGWRELRYRASSTVARLPGRKPGFTARYWNNVTRDGEPVTTAQVTTPFHFCTSGATVFAPGVNLTDFSATYNSVFTPDQSGEVVFDIYAYGSGRLRINGEEVRGFSNQHGGQKSAYTLQVQAGKRMTLNWILNISVAMHSWTLTLDLRMKWM